MHLTKFAAVLAGALLAGGLSNGAAAQTYSGTAAAPPQGDFAVTLGNLFQPRQSVADQMFGPNSAAASGGGGGGFGSPGFGNQQNMFGPPQGQFGGFNNQFRANR